MKKKIVFAFVLVASVIVFFLNINDLYAIPPINKACVYSVEDPGGPIGVECKGEGEICGDSVKCKEPRIE